MHGSVSAPSCCVFTHRVAFEEVSVQRVLLKSGPGNRGRSACATTPVAHLEFPRADGLILRCAGKAGNPFQTTQGNRHSCRHEEGRRGSDEVVSGPSVFPSRELGVSGKFWVRLMNYVGYDVVALGNHELDYGMQQMFALTEALEAPVLCANLKNLQTNAHPYPAYHIIRYGDVDVAYLGLTTTTSGTVASLSDEQGHPLYSFMRETFYENAQHFINEARKEGQTMLWHWPTWATALKPEGTLILWNSSETPRGWTPSLTVTTTTSSKNSLSATRRDIRCCSPRLAQAFNTLEAHHQHRRNARRFSHRHKQRRNCSR